LANRTLAADILGKLPLFRHTPPARLAEIARHARTEHVARGTVIARRGEKPRGLMAVAYGLVKLSLKGETEKVLRLVGPGETFAEAVLFLDKPLPVDAVALADTLLVVVRAAPLLALIDADRAFARGLLASMSQRMHELVMDFEATTQHGARERLASVLSQLGRRSEAAAELAILAGHLSEEGDSDAALVAERALTLDPSCAAAAPSPRPRSARTGATWPPPPAAASPPSGIRPPPRIWCGSKVTTAPCARSASAPRDSAW